MIKITLYKNAKIDERYSEVFAMGKFLSDNKSPLEKYLENLTQTVYELDTVYQENNGTFIFEDVNIKYDIYEYNYLKVQTISEQNTVLFTRYCFIESITIKNGCYYVDYKEDIWHSYSGSITGIFKQSNILDRSRILNYHNNFEIEIFKPSIDAFSNKPLRLFPFIGGSNSYNAILEIQIYKTDSSGTPTERKIDLFVLKNAGKSGLTSSAIAGYIKQLILFSSSKEINENSSAGTLIDTWRYKIGNIWIFPTTFRLEDQINPELNYLEISDTYYTMVPLSDNWNEELVNTSLIYNFKNLSIGTINSRIELNRNGLSTNIKLIYNKYITNLSILLNAEGSLIDIAKDFLIDYPIEPLNSEELALLKLSREQGTAKEVFNIISDAVSLITKAGQLDVNNTKERLNAVTSAGTEQPVITGLKAVTAGISNIVNRANYLEYFLNTAFDIAKSGMNIYALNAKYYSSNTGKIVTNNVFVNIKYGVFIEELDISNQEIIDYSINKEGYQVVKEVEDFAKLNINNNLELMTENNIEYNVIRFSSVNVYGKFPQVIAQSLNTILEMGVIIKYGNI